MELILTSFVAGILTVLSPCVLPLLPVIIGGSLTNQDKKRPLIITASLAISITLFTLVLKTTAVFINVSPELIKYVSGGIILFLGLITVFPRIWEKISIKLRLQNTSDDLLNKSTEKKGTWGAILTGASLGPVFASCSPTYAIIIATVLPASFSNGLINLVAYALGLGLFMLLISVFGQKLIKRVRFAANPNGKFRRGLGVLFVIVGLLVITGYDKKVQVYLLKYDFLNGTTLETKLYNGNNNNSSTDFNVSQPYNAPELQGIAGWINSDPVRIADLKGKVVVIDFWTYSCINCIRTLPSLTTWYDKYEKDGLVIIGVHAPEFQFEKNKENVQKAVTEFGVKYPVAQDNDFDTWKAYKNQYWPSKYFIDRDGKVRHTHFGEGDYAASEQIIRKLLTENGSKLSSSETVTNDDSTAKNPLTPETYLGYSREMNQANSDGASTDKQKTYKLSENLKPNQWSIGGDWLTDSEKVNCKGDNCSLNINFSAQDVYLIIGGTGSVSNITVNGKDVVSEKIQGKDIDSSGKIIISEYKLYHIVHQPGFVKDQILKFDVTNGIMLNTFTFG